MKEFTSQYLSDDVEVVGFTVPVEWLEIDANQNSFYSDVIFEIEIIPDAIEGQDYTTVGRIYDEIIGKLEDFVSGGLLGDGVRDRSR